VIGELHETANRRVDPVDLGDVRHRRLREAQQRRRQEEVARELLARLAQAGQVGDDVLVLAEQGLHVLLVDAGGPLSAEEATTARSLLVGRGGGRRRRPVGAGGRGGAGHAGDEDVGADRLQRRQHLVLGVVESLRHADDPDHEPYPESEAEGGEDGAAQTPPQLAGDVGQVEHGGHSQPPPPGSTLRNISVGAQPAPRCGVHARAHE